MGKQSRLKQQRRAERGSAPFSLSGQAADITGEEPPAPTLARLRRDPVIVFTRAQAVTACAYNPQGQQPTEPYFPPLPPLPPDSLDIYSYPSDRDIWGNALSELVVTEDTEEKAEREDWLVVEPETGKGDTKITPVKPEAEATMLPELYRLGGVEFHEERLLTSKTELPAPPAPTPPPTPAAVVAIHDLVEYLGVDPPVVPPSLTNDSLRDIAVLECDTELLTAIEAGDASEAYKAIESRRVTLRTLLERVQVTLLTSTVDPRVQTLVDGYDEDTWRLSREIGGVRARAEEGRARLRRAQTQWQSVTEANTIRAVHVRLMTSEHMLRASPTWTNLGALETALAQATELVETITQTEQVISTEEAALFALNQLAQGLVSRVRQTLERLQQLPAACEQFGFPFPDTLRQKHSEALKRAQRLADQPVSILAGLRGEREIPTHLSDIAEAMERRRALAADTRVLLAHPPKSDDDIRRLVFLFFAASVEGSRRGYGLRMVGLVLVHLGLLTEAERGRVKDVMETQRRFFRIIDVRGTRKRPREIWNPLPEAMDIGRAELTAAENPPDNLIQRVRDGMKATREADQSKARERMAARKLAAGAEGQNTEDEDDDS